MKTGALEPGHIAKTCSRAKDKTCSRAEGRHAAELKTCSRAAQLRAKPEKMQFSYQGSWRRELTVFYNRYQEKELAEGRLSWD